MNINGNITAVIQKKTTGRNIIGESTESWSDVGIVLGWLDYSYSAGQSSVNQYQAKIQDTTHVFLCDWKKWKDATQDASITSENCRMVINDTVYNVLMIDDPMELHQHIEIYLKYVGGGLGV